MKKDKKYFMKLAMQLALKGKGKTSPNPIVGALVVKDGKIIGEGFHERCGFSHAEAVALNKAGKNAKGATLFVTLEPCAHFGRTPPCVESIIRSGVKKVVVGMIDPNPLNNGRGVSILKQNNIKVEVGFLEEELRRMNEVFIKYITKRIPFITVKVAESMDGKIATRSGDSKWITSDKSLSHSHHIRKDYDAIMVGVNTVLRDNPKLNAWFSKKNPIKIVIDSQLSTPQDANIFSENSQVIIVTLPHPPGQETENKQILEKKAKILEVKEKSGEINLRDAVKKLARMEITNILVEGGGTLIGSLFDEGLVDKILFFVAPKIIGGKNAISPVMGQGIARMDKAIKIKDIKLKRLGEDFLFEGRI